MLSSITHLGFGPTFIQWMKIFYNDLESQVIFNGWRTRSFKY